MPSVLDKNNLRQRTTMLLRPVPTEREAQRLKAAVDIEQSHEELRRQRDDARRVAVEQRIRQFPDCEDVPDPLRTRRHTAVGLFRITWEEAKLLYPDPEKGGPT